MRVLVTGYGGFLGSAICRLLINQGYEVLGLARNSYASLIQNGVEPILGDVACSKTCKAACRGCDAIIHTAAKAGVWGSWNEYYRCNTLATRVLIEAAEQAGAKAFVYTSSPSVTFAGEPQSDVDETAPYPKRWLCHYPHTKALGEQAVLSAGKDGKLLTCSLRPHLIWGEGDPHLFPRVIQRACSGRLRRVGNGRNLIDVVHVSNAARAHLLALERLLDGDDRLNGQAFFVTDGRPVECWQWITRILESGGVSIPTGSLSYSAAYAIGAALETLFKVAGKRSEPPMTRFVAAQLALDHYFSIDKARHLLGYEPEVDQSAEFTRCRPWLRSLVETVS